MKIQVLGNSLVATSDIRKADYDLLKKHNPDALKIKDKDGNTTFTIGYGEHGYVNKSGVGFNGVSRDNDKHLTLTLDVTGINDVKEYAADLFGAVIDSVAQVEKSVASEAEATSKKRAEFLENVTVG